MNYILYNPSSNNGACKVRLDEFLNENETKYEILNVLEGIDYDKILSDSEEIVIVGGDGTLNHFINDTKNHQINCDVYFLSSGSGNDFLNDLNKKEEKGKIKINQYLENLPKVIVNDKEYLFINGIGYGIDGYCCEAGDEQRKKSSKPVNYTSIAIKGLLFHFKAPNAKITINGETKEYKKVWLAPTMKGRFYGGGMMVAPEQDRLDNDHYVSTVVFHGSSKLKTLMIFPSIFKGGHVKHTKYIEIVKTHEVEVEFDRPTALQIDGETVLGVTKYKVIAK